MVYPYKKQDCCSALDLFHCLHQTFHLRLPRKSYKMQQIYWQQCAELKKVISSIVQYRQKRNVWLSVSWNSLQEFRVTRILVSPSQMTNINLCWFQNNIMGKFLWNFSRILIGTTVNKTAYSYYLKPLNLLLLFRVFFYKYWGCNNCQSWALKFCIWYLYQGSHGKFFLRFFP